jgi:hypothetical protein
LTAVWANANVTNHYSDVIGCYQKSAEVIVGMKRAPKKKNRRPHKTTEGLNVKVRQTIKETIEAKKKKKIAETRKRTAYRRIGRKPKVKCKRSIAEIRKTDRQAVVN